jgi:hypothetical protein
MRRAAIAAAVLVLSTALAGCSGPSTPSPVAAIPKLTVDFEDNVTSIYITSVNADVRYTAITVVLGNENLTSPVVLQENKSFALVGHTALTFFHLNATADEDGTHYFYNATFHIAPKSPPDPGPTVTYQIYIRETADGSIQTESIPFRHVLQEGAH